MPEPIIREVQSDVSLMAKLAAKLSLIASEIPCISKDARNEFHKYDYVTDVAVLDTVRACAIKHGVVILPSFTQVAQTAINKSDKGGNPIMRTVVDVMFRVIDVETGYYMQLHWSGESLNSADKGMAMAATSAIKYFLLKLFLIPATDVDSDGAKEVEAHDPKARTSGGKSKASGEEFIRSLFGDITKSEPYKRFFRRAQSLGMSPNALALRALGEGFDPMHDHYEQIITWAERLPTAGEQ